MNITEIDITPLLEHPQFSPFELSNNRATMGENVASLTWNAAKHLAKSIQLIDIGDEKQKQACKEAFLNFIRESGGWSDEEIEAWDGTELNALLFQWIAGDIREAFGDQFRSEWDWEKYEKDSESGRISGRLFRSQNGTIYFSFQN